MKNDGLKKLHWSGMGAKRIHRNKKTWLVGVALLILAAGGYTAYRVFYPFQAGSGAAPQLQTAVARLGDLTIFATGAGQLVPASETSIGFDESGTLSELLVKVGDKVRTGQVLARLQTEQTDAEIALAKADAQQKVLSAQQALNDLYSSAAQDAAQALKAVQDAEQGLKDLQNNDLQAAQALQAVTEAQKAVADAQQAYNNARTPADQGTIDSYYAQLVLAQAKLKDAAARFDDYAKKPDDDPEKAAEQLKYSAALNSYNNALRNYNAVSGTGSEIEQQITAADLAAAQAKLADAQREYARLKNGPSDAEIALAQSNLAVANAQYEKLKNSPDPVEIEVAKANLASAQDNLEEAETAQTVLELTAPADGTILSIDASVGEALETGNIITIADLSQPMLDVYLDETDLDKIVAGYEADVVFDSLPDSTFTGRVVEINPSLETVANVNTVAARVQLDVNAGTGPLSLPVGSNATVDVISGRTQNAVLVPVEALREITPGEYAVFVMQNGEPRLRPVKVGLMDYTSAEITDGLQAGDIVTTGVVETKSGS
jgi:HlyD family secretion protein